MLGAPGKREHVHRRVHGRDDRRDVGGGGQAGGVDAVGPGRPVGDEPGDGVVQVVAAVEVVLGPCGEHHRIALVGRRGGGRDPLGGRCDRVDPPGRGVVVLDRAAGGAGAGQQAHGLGDSGRIGGEAALAVDRERQVGGGGEAGDVGDELVARDGLVVSPQRPREPGARRRERRKAAPGEQAGRALVPRVGHHEDALLRVQLPEPRPAIGDRCGHGEELSAVPTPPARSS